MHTYNDLYVRLRRMTLRGFALQALQRTGPLRVTGINSDTYRDIELTSDDWPEPSGEGEGRLVAVNLASFDHCLHQVLTKCEAYLTKLDADRAQAAVAQ